MPRIFLSIVSFLRRPPPTWDKSQNQSWNGLAVGSFVLGILPGSLFAVGLGMVQTRTVAR